jgi:hypothetical protein
VLLVLFLDNSRDGKVRVDGCLEVFPYQATRLFLQPNYISMKSEKDIFLFVDFESMYLRELIGLSMGVEDGWLTVFAYKVCLSM